MLETLAILGICGSLMWESLRPGSVGRMAHSPAGRTSVVIAATLAFMIR